MRPAAYIAAINELLVTDPIVKEFCIRRERTTLTDGHIRARLELMDGSWLEFSEYVRREADGTIDVITYSYHWANAADELIRRWDNTPHHPDLSGFPHHVHDGIDGVVREGKRTSIFEVLERISGEITER